MKRVIVICDGMADNPVSVLGDKTPLESAATPSMDYMASHGRCGSLQTIPENSYPGSETAILTILGYKPEELPAGRGPLEAAGLGIMCESCTAMRYQLPEANKDIETIKTDFPDTRFYPLTDTTGLCLVADDAVCPRDSDCIRFWSADRAQKYVPFSTRHSGSSAAIVGATPLLAGIAKAIGVDWIKPDGATGDCDTDYGAKARAAMTALDSHDIVIIHVEACDYASHHNDITAKVRAIEKTDSMIVKPFLNRIIEGDSNLGVAVMSDHPSLCEKGCHTSDPVPFLYYYEGIGSDSVTRFSENDVKNGDLSNISEIYG